MLLNIGKKFAGNRKGNFSLVGALAFPVLFSGVALSVDMSNSLRARTDLQNANDSAVLFATRYFQENKKVPDSATVAKFLTANYEGPVQVVKVDFDKKTSEMTLTSKVVLKPMVMGYFGNSATLVNAESRATLGVAGILEFALALDTTASMSADGRMNSLKVAANNFVNLLYDVQERGAEVKGAIVPFSRYVNVGVGYRNESWMDVPKDIDTRKTEKVCNTSRPVVSWTNCKTVSWPAQTINHPATSGWCSNNDGIQTCYPGSPGWTEFRPGGSSQQCDPVYGAEVKNCWNQESGSLITWHGCVGSREYPYNVQDVFNGKKFPGLMDVTCAEPLQTLTNNRQVLLNKINSLVPADNTYIHEGVMWGMRTLSAWKPFTDGLGPKSPNEKSKSEVHKIRKALVIMTDGENTLSQNTSGQGGRNKLTPNTSWHEGSNTAQANRYTLEACDHAKSQDMEVYTISFGSEMSASIRELLEKCASKKDFSFHASNGAALDDAFQDIADQLLSVRLSQ